MKRILPAFLALAACASSRTPGLPATVTLLGSEGRLETWEAVAAEGEHLHPAGGEMCALFRKMTAAVFSLEEPKARGAAKGLAAVTEANMEALYGKAYGGPDRLVLGLRRFAPGKETPEEAVFVDLPALKANETERAVDAPDFTAEYLSPVPSVRARLDRGRVRVRRLGPGRYEFEVFLVLRPVEGGAAFERFQVVTRVEAGPPR